MGDLLRGLRDGLCGLLNGLGSSFTASAAWVTALAGSGRYVSSRLTGTAFLGAS